MSAEADKPGPATAPLPEPPIEEAGTYHEITRYLGQAIPAPPGTPAPRRTVL